MKQSNNFDNTMIANELFQKSMRNMKYPKARGMSSRSFLYACRNNFGTINEGINTQKLLNAIESGEVWHIHGVGKKTISQWREEFLTDFAQRFLRCKSPNRKCN
jgi:hypothetical protein